MQNINLNKKIELENKILDLLVISIDDQIETIDDKDCTRLEGKVVISGKAKTLEGEKEFLDYIDIDIFLAKEEIESRNDLNVCVNDFNYTLEDNSVIFDILLKVEGLKEIQTTFLAEENNEFFSEEEIEEKNAVKEQIEDKKELLEEEREKTEEINQVEALEEKRVYIDKEIEINDTNTIENEEILITEEQVDKIQNEDDLIDEEIIEQNKIEINEETNKKSLLRSVFSNKRFKEEVSWRLHCVKNETSYEEISKKYNVNLDKLIYINKNEKLVEGKLIFLPLD